MRLELVMALLSAKIAFVSLLVMATAFFWREVLCLYFGYGVHFLAEAVVCTALVAFGALMLVGTTFSATRLLRKSKSYRKAVTASFWLEMERERPFLRNYRMVRDAVLTLLFAATTAWCTNITAICVITTVGFLTFCGGFYEIGERIAKPLNDGPGTLAGGFERYRSDLSPAMRTDFLRAVGNVYGTQSLQYASQLSRNARSVLPSRVFPAAEEDDVLIAEKMAKEAIAICRKHGASLVLVRSLGSLAASNSLQWRKEEAGLLLLEALRVVPKLNSDEQKLAYDDVVRVSRQIGNQTICTIAVFQERMLLEEQKALRDKQIDVWGALPLPLLLVVMAGLTVDSYMILDNRRRWQNQLASTEDFGVAIQSFDCLVTYLLYSHQYELANKASIKMIEVAENFEVLKIRESAELFYDATEFPFGIPRKSVASN